MYLLSVTRCILFYLFIFLIQWLINLVSDCHGREIENSRLVFSNPWFDNKASALQVIGKTGTSLMAAHYGM
jgi:hypothetical protein